MSKKLRFTAILLITYLIVINSTLKAQILDGDIETLIEYSKANQVGGIVANERNYSSNKNILFVELAGSNIIYSFNYEKIFNATSFRVGAGYVRINQGYVEGDWLGMLVTASKFRQVSTNSFFEYGAGITTENIMSIDNRTSITSILGFRNQNYQSRYSYRMFLAPILRLNRKENMLILHAGVSFGRII